MDVSSLITLFAATIMGISFIFLILPVMLRAWVHIRVRPRVYPLDGSVPGTEAAIILGAALWPDGSPTPVLHDRVMTGVELHKSGRVELLLMSGDGRTDSYNEPDAMRKLAIDMGIPEEKILLDYGGLRTYESLVRARRVYKLTSVTIVTQRFHLDRALYLAASIGLNAIGVVADRRRYRFWALQRSRLRELIATAKAWIDVHVYHEVMGG